VKSRKLGPLTLSNFHGRTTTSRPKPEATGVPPTKNTARERGGHLPKVSVLHVGRIIDLTCTRLDMGKLSAIKKIKHTPSQPENLEKKKKTGRPLKEPHP